MTYEIKNLITLNNSADLNTQIDKMLEIINFTK